MSVFLVGAALADRIREVCSGEGVDCAVAFWGGDFHEQMFAGGKKRRIICDISMGCNSQKALARLGAPDDPDLKVCDGLHTKVYISSTGVVIGSANASGNGLGSSASPPGNLEAGTFHKVNSTVWKCARDWFEELFSSSPVLDRDQLDRAPLRARDPGKQIASTGLLAKSLLERVRSYPERFADTLFVATSQEIEEQALARHQRNYDKEASLGVFEPAKRDFVMGDKPKNLLPSRPYLVMFWFGTRPGLYAYTRVVGTPDVKPRAVFGRSGWKSFWKDHGMPEPGRAAAFAFDRQMVKSIKRGEWVYTSYQLQEALGR